MKFLSFFDSDLKKIMIFADKNYIVSNEKSKKDFCITYRTHIESIREMRQSFIDFGYIHDKDEISE